MNRTKIILNSSSKKEAYCDRKEYFERYSEYDSQECFKKLQKGAPLVINIGGTYYYYDKLEPFFGSSVAFDNYRRELTLPKSADYPPIFIWN